MQTVFHFYCILEKYIIYSIVLFLNILIFMYKIHLYYLWNCYFNTRHKSVQFINTSGTFRIYCLEFKWSLISLSSLGILIKNRIHCAKIIQLSNHEPSRYCRVSSVKICNELTILIGCYGNRSWETRMLWIIFISHRYIIWYIKLSNYFLLHKYNILHYECEKPFSNY